jgi:hypothetical protein
MSIASDHTIIDSKFILVAVAYLSTAVQAPRKIVSVALQTVRLTFVVNTYSYSCYEITGQPCQAPCQEGTCTGGPGTHYK